MRAAAVVALVALMGCSLAVQPVHSRVAPGVDAAVAGAAGLGCLMALGGGDGGDAAPPGLLCVPLVPIAIVYGLSAMYGFDRTDGER